jgi:hypothetical protein
MHFAIRLHQLYRGKFTLSIQLVCNDVHAETPGNVSQFCRILTQIGTCQHILDKVPKYEILQKS